MKIKSRFLGVAAVATLAGSLVVVAAPAAHAATPLGGCSGLTALATITPALPGDGSVASVIVAAKDLKAGTQVSAAAIGGAVVTAGAGASCNVLGHAFVSKTSTKLSGVATCSTTSTDPTQYPLNGKLSLKDAAVTGTSSAYMRVQGFDTTAGPDVIDVTGIVTKGNAVGATVGGSLGFDPIAHDPTPKSKNYVFDTAQLAAACGGPGGTPIGLVFVTDGTTLLGSTATGLSFSF